MPASIWTKFSVKNCDENQLSEGHLLEMKTIDDCVDYGSKRYVFFMLVDACR